MAKKAARRKTAKPAASRRPPAATGTTGGGRTPRARSGRRPRRSRSARALSLDGMQAELLKRWPELNQQRLAAIRDLAEVRDPLMAQHGVTGVHAGLRRQRTDESGTSETWVSPLQFCIRVHVQQKYDNEHDPRIRSLLPKSFGRTPVDVFQQSYMSLAGETRPDDFADRLEGGVPIALQSLQTDHWGTLGGVVFCGNQVRYLTNRHVIDPDLTGRISSERILQPPSGITSGDVSAVVGTVVDVAPPGDIDAALIRPSGRRRRSRSIRGVDSRLFVSGALTAADEHHTRAFKVGARTGRTTGIVRNTRATVMVNGRTMHNQILVEPEAGQDLCDGGDSGALLIVETQQNGITINQVVGLVHAEGSMLRDGDNTPGSFSHRSIIACHFRDVQDYFGIRV